MTAATRSNVLRARRRLAQIGTGAALLRSKRKSLALELFARARPAVDARRGLDEQARAAYRALIDALAALGLADLAPLGWPTRAIKVDASPREVAGIRGIDLVTETPVLRSVAARGEALGPNDAAAAAAAEQFERLLEQLLAAAPEEIFLRRLAEALSRATRLVNTLEQKVAPALARELAEMKRTLDEREREEHARIKHLARTRGSEKK